MKLTFFGGAKSVTGANYLLESDGAKILVDCGLVQGSRYCERQNFEKFPYNPKEIQAVLITHAHIDHTGRLPMLFRAGFRGGVYSTAPTKDIAELVLLDSEHILSEEAKDLRMSIPYDTSDVLGLMKLWQEVPYHNIFRIGDFECEFYDAGHILGSAEIIIKAEGKKIVFSGDLGNSPEPLIKSVEYVPDADFALVESVYGSRTHEGIEVRKDKLEDIIEDTVRLGGVLMIPAFALERTQELLFELNDLVENERIPKVPIFVDSPLAIKITAIYQKYATEPMYFNKESIGLIRGGDAIFDFPGLQMTMTTAQSREINNVSAPKVIIAGAGMSQGGRILHHEFRYLPDAKSTILFFGFQAKGSLGRQIFDKAKTVRIFGEQVSVQARVEAIGGYSGHADQPKLLNWLKAMRLSVKKVFVVQGEEEEAQALVQEARDKLAIDAVMPSQGEEVVL